MKNKKIMHAALFISIPLIVCIIFTALQGLAVWQVNPFYSLWNDEVFYFKQIEGIVNFGAPLGFFGYNESAAAIGTLGAWSPFLLYPYALIGKIIGATPYLMLICNLFFLTIAFAAFYFLAKPNLEQSIKISLFLLATPIFLRYCLSFMTEPLFYSFVIIFAGFTIYFQNSQYTRKSIYIFYLLGIYATICRPWMLIFLLIPAYYLFKKSKAESIISFFAATIISALVYILYALPRCAPCVSPIINTTMFTVLKEQGLFEFIKYNLQIIFNAIKEIAKAMLFVIKAPSDISATYYLFFILGLILTIYIVNIILKKDKENPKKIVTCIGIIGIMAIVLLAIIVLHTYVQGSRHLISLCIFAGLIICMQYLPKNKFQALAILLVLGVFGWSLARYDYAYQLPTENEASIITNSSAKLSNSFVASPLKSRWENTVIYDVSVNSNYCYFLPKGAGINLCFQDYIPENADNIKAGYILTVYTAEQDATLQNAGWEILTQEDEFVLYQRTQ